jgi:hypothetical protein
MDFMCSYSGFSWLRIGSVANCREHSSESSGSVNGGAFLYQMSDYELLKKDLLHGIR